jgi:hypothetical protein
MPDIPYRTLLLVSLGASLTLVSPIVDPAAASRPKVTVLCLPPGASAPRPCEAAMPNSMLELDLATIPALPNHLIFSEVDAIGPPRSVSVQIKTPGRAGPVRLALPRQLCAYRDVGRWRVEVATADQRRTSIGAVTVRC